MLKKHIVIFFAVLLMPAISLAEGIDGGDKKFQGFNLQGYTQEGEKSWDVKGESADIVGTQVNLKKVDANAYGEQKVNLTAETGSIDQASGNMRLEKDVVIRSEEGQQLMTNSLDWNKEANEVTTEDNVTITDERITATGKGLKAQPGLKNAQINKDVTVMMNTEAGVSAKTLTITSDGPMMIDQIKSMAEFHDNVIAIQEDKTLKANRMEIYFDQTQKQIKEIICIGNVVIDQGENKTYADRAVYNAKDKKITLSGRPKIILLTEGENAITSIGDKESR
ncbi:MAG TPA: LPS export ABC transporter periplasmic protein LptC [Candidatus Omnitrophota bacterium]|nr:LPS export ABC transporter periplasmic protein LptC [Candidatus Omnitrophota bacterium]HPN87878.1 LPS export ABC transporter periplasmic protein LptC [Candidatus Omnitrophota bacterium]